MRFTDVFIRRPVFAASLSLLLLIIGLISFNSLNIRQYPKMEANIIAISTSYPGANAETVESFVTSRVEDAISGVDDIDYITSSSSAGSSDVVINLVLNADVDSAMNDIDSDLSSVLREFPEGVEDPIVTKVDPDSMPTMVIVFSSHQKTAEQITDYLNRVVVPQVSTISGVGSADVIGNRTYAMRLWLDPRKMSALGVTAKDIEDALDDNNVQAQPGEIDRSQQVVTINAQTDLRTAEEFNDLVVKESNKRLVRLKDIGKAELGAASYNTSLYIDNISGVGLSVSVKSSASPLQVSKDVKVVMNEIAKQMPQDLNMAYARDSSTYIETSVHEVIRTIIEAALFVFIVIFLFLGSLRTVIVPLVTIPLSLVGAFGFMFMMGYTINTITLLAFVLAIGMVVDDAIVVLENIHRYIQMGKKPIEAALAGTHEISFAVVAMTFTLAAVFAPIGFTSGFTSILFKEFAFTLAGTVIISGFIALTLSPMMCSKIMRTSQKENYLEHKIDSYLTKLTSFYQKLLQKVLVNKLNIIFVLLAVFVMGLIFLKPLSAESTLTPTEDQGIVIGMAVGPTASNIAYTQKYTSLLPDIYKNIPELTRYAVINGRPGGENHAMTFVSLKDWGERERSAQEIQQQLMQQTSHIPGLSLMFFSPSSIPGSNSMYPVEMVIKSTGDYQELNNIAQQFVNKLEATPGIMRVQSDLKLDSPELNVSLNRSKAALLGVNMSDVNSALKIALGEPDLSSFVREGESFDVIPQLSGEFRDSASSLNNISVATSSDQLIPLSNIMSIEKTVAPSSLNHFQQQRSVTLSLVLADGYSQQEAIDVFKNLAAELLPNHMTYDFSGDTRQFIKSGSSMLQIFIFSLLFIYLILSSQFESFKDPLVVMFTVPLSLVGALATIYMVGASLNIYTEIGLITLVGLISKHGILIVEFANQLQAQGKKCQEAVIEAAAIRLRPILMTTAAMVLGACPLVLAGGAGAASRSQMGWTIIGGMTFGTLLTLFVIPTMYVLIVREKK